MPGLTASTGPIASVIVKIIGLVFDEDQLPEVMKRRKLAAEKERCRRALIDNDWERLAQAVEKLRDVASKP